MSHSSNHPGRKGSRNELVEVRAGYVIHAYSFSDTTCQDLHLQGPGLSRVIFDVEPKDLESAISELRALIDAKQAAGS